MLATEKGVKSEEAAAHSGDRDREIGNTHYVFANADTLRSRSAGGPYAYRIATDEGYVVPLDIASIRSPDLVTPRSKDEADNYDLDMYAKNLYTIPDFKVLFATYCAVLFDQPDAAIDFFHRNWFWPDSAKCWDDAQMRDDGEDSPIKRRMRELLIKGGIEPPVSPEFQFKDQVVGELVIEK